MLHERVARRWRLSALGVGVGGGALLGSLVGWLGALAALPHLLLVLGGALVVGILAPLHRSAWRDAQALTWIGERVGLAYETAWGLQQHDRTGGPVAQALAEATRVQGRLSVRDLQPPPVSTWWLPLVMAATVLWLWSWVAGPPLLGIAERWGAPPPAENAAVAAVEGSEAEAAAGEPLEGDPPAETNDAAAPIETGEALAEGGGPPAVGGDAVGSGGRAAERDTFERFLESLRERPPEEPEEPEGAASLAQSGDQEEDGEEAPVGSAAEEGSSRDPFAGGGDQVPTTDANGEEEGVEPAAADDVGVDAGDSPGEGGELGEGVADDGGEPGDEALGERDVDATGGMPEETAGVDGVEDATSNGGLGVGAPTTSDEGEMAQGAEPEALPSLLGPGPELPVGGVQLPGASPEGPLPVGDGGPEFERAVERALLEGDLPAPYQEVIRSYFR
jgi:hypothetical protein